MAGLLNAPDWDRADLMGVSRRPSESSASERPRRVARLAFLDAVRKSMRASAPRFARRSSIRSSSRLPRRSSTRATFGARTRARPPWRSPRRRSRSRRSCGGPAIAAGSSAQWSGARGPTCSGQGRAVGECRRETCQRPRHRRQVSFHTDLSRRPNMPDWLRVCLVGSKEPPRLDFRSLFTSRTGRTQ